MELKGFFIIFVLVNGILARPDDYDDYYANGDYPDDESGLACSDVPSQDPVPEDDISTYPDFNFM